MSTYTELTKEERKQLRENALQAHLRALPPEACQTCGKHTLIRRGDTVCDWCLYT